MASDDFEAGWRILEDLTSNAALIQQQVLEEIITRNANTEYLRSFLNGKFDKELFKKKVPVVDYEDIKPYMERIASGEPPEILLDSPVPELLISSGTSGGKPKMVPSSTEYLDKKLFGQSLRASVMMKRINGLNQGKWMFLQFMKPETKTSSGLVARSYITSLAKHIQQRKIKNDLYSSPCETILCSDIKQSMYSQLLCGLVERDEVVIVGAPFASTFLNIISFLEDHWKELCLDIRTGHASDLITDPSCRNSVSVILSKPDPKLADSIEQACSASSGKSWEGIVRKLWPRTKGLLTIVTGSMAQYIPTLQYYSGGLPLLSTVYASTECFFGLNLNPLCQPSDISYTLLPNMAYFEFLPVNSKDSDVFDEDSTIKENIVELVDVKVGQCYEVVTTTNAGLYRYRVGDILKIIGFYNNAPQVQIVGRRNVVLSLGPDKTTEEDLSKAVTKAQLHLEPFGFLLVDYTSYADTTSTPGHYVLFWELKKKEGSCGVEELDSKLMDQCCCILEEYLDDIYKMYRHENAIAPLEIRVLEGRTFDTLMEFFIAKGSSLSQYKTPRCIKSEEALGLLKSRVVGRFFSHKTSF
ncbi:hypothetical protein SLEP1_g9548 [Rubroshorea leprosula]|uniref:Indole-3-acetic acid-amido synthetase GH3.17-like n=1 Tax=Rubroshorea leprosula TaxID=152421 RepID=A0AAV5IF62_9ROSI|nr:hypothetical protein SLEP1_g9548 [Rubroshorea leprosula]